MTLMKVSSQDVFEIKCRTEDGLLKQFTAMVLNMRARLVRTLLKNRIWTFPLITTPTFLSILRIVCEAVHAPSISATFISI